MRWARVQKTLEQASLRRKAITSAMRSARAQETPAQALLRREANTGAMRSARAQENPHQSRRRRASDNDATAVRPRIAPAASSTASAVAYVDFGNTDVEC